MNLEVHVFGADQGESILIKFPNDQWGVVDCYSPTKNADSNELLKFLLDQKVKQLHFVCLTHPHHDHYSGLTHVLEQIPTRQFWYPAVMTVDLLRCIIKLEQQAHKASSDQEFEGKLIELWEKVNTLHADSKLSIQKLTLGLDLGVDDDLGNVKIVSLAPSGNESHHFERGLAACFNDGKLKSRKQQAYINRSSVALSLTYLGYRLVLGGDVETHGWIDLLDQRKNLASDACVVKVAHHGSSTGRCENLWKTFAGNTTKRVAVLTPYWKHRLPSQSVVSEILSTGYDLYSTSKIGRPTKSDSPEQAIAKLVSGTLPKTSKGGVVSIAIDARGSLSTNLNGQARKL
jgi:beta-lactamase superfamily II metal-dependent hydrolase